jgi:beta-glucuronidase
MIIFLPVFRLTTRYVAACICTMLVIPAFGQRPLQILLVGIDHRAATSLNGDWHDLVDQTSFRALYKVNGDINDRGYALHSVQYREGAT